VYLQSRQEWERSGFNKEGNMHILLTPLEDGGRQLDIDMPLAKGLIKTDKDGQVIHWQFRPRNPEHYIIGDNTQQHKVLPNGSIEPMKPGNKADNETKVYKPKFELPGDKLAQAFENVGIKKKSGCSCQEHQNKMNEFWIKLEQEYPNASQKELSKMYVNKHGLTIAKWLAAEAIKQRVVITPTQLLKITKEVMGYQKYSVLGSFSPKKIWSRFFNKTSKIEKSSTTVEENSETSQ
jgi:hypothetical protein